MGLSSLEDREMKDSAWIVCGATYALVVAVTTREHIGTETYWLSLIACLGSFLILRNFFRKETISLSVYDLRHGEEPFVSFARAIWAVVAIVIIVMCGLLVLGVKVIEYA